MLKTFSTLFIIAILFFAACEKGTEDEIPSYISIDKIDLFIHPDSVQKYGSSAHKITDAWVYIDNEFIGVFETPAKIPVLKSGTHSLRIDPGILINGIGATRSPYPYYQSVEQEVELVKKEVLQIPTPATQYYTNTKFKWLENFEAGVSIDTTTDSNTDISRSSDPTIAFEGACGAIFLDENHNKFEGISPKLKLPRGGENVYLELNYRTNNEFHVGVRANNFDGTPRWGDYIILRDTKGSWKKIYINLTSYVSAATDAIDYNIFIAARKDESLNNAAIYVDNIKLVHF